MLLPLQGVNTMAIRNTQGVASLALGYALLGFQPVHYRRHLNFSAQGVAIGLCSVALSGRIDTNMDGLKAQ